jgi:hypothetical protein
LPAEFPSLFLFRALAPSPARCYDDAMPEDGSLELDDWIVWYKNGNIHREDGSGD